jgi:hypothetical protein
MAVTTTLLRDHLRERLVSDFIMFIPWPILEIVSDEGSRSVTSRARVKKIGIWLPRLRRRVRMALKSSVAPELPMTSSRREGEGIDDRRIDVRSKAAALAIWTASREGFRPRMS